MLGFAVDHPVCMRGLKVDNLASHESLSPGIITTTKELHCTPYIILYYISTSTTLLLLFIANSCSTNNNFKYSVIIIVIKLE